MKIPDVIPISWKIGTAVALCGVLWAGYAYWHHEVYQDGYDVAEALYKKREAKATSDALTEKGKLDSAVNLKQAELDSALSKLSSKEKEYRDEQIKSSAYQRDLAAGNKRLRVLTTANSNCSAGQASGRPSANVDSLPEISTELEPKIASNLVGLTDIGDQAITRLNACISAYQALETAVNAK